MPQSQPPSLRKRFQSTPSVGRATLGGRKKQIQLSISIHALRGEGDIAVLIPFELIRYFNPRPPWGGRQTAKESRVQEMPFQSTPSVGRATPVIQTIKAIELFQSTPSVGRATSNFRILSNSSTFQSTPSVGRATFNLSLLRASKAISIHALRGEGDRSRYMPLQQRCDFNPRPPWGGRLYIGISKLCKFKFQSTPSVGRATIRHINSLRNLEFQSTPSVGRATINTLIPGSALT